MIKPKNRRPATGWDTNTNRMFLPIYTRAINSPYSGLGDIKYQRNRCMPHHPPTMIITYLPLVSRLSTGRESWVAIVRTVPAKGSNARQPTHSLGARFRNVCFNKDVPFVNRCSPQPFSGSQRQSQPASRRRRRGSSGWCWYGRSFSPAIRTTSYGYIDNEIRCRDVNSLGKLFIWREYVFP